jgi:uncharacterized protein
MNRVHLMRTTVLAVVLMLMAGCGYKNSPVPPESVVPQPIEDLRYTVSDQGVSLTWSFPVKSIRGKILEDISSFELYRAEIALDDYCGGCPIPFGKPLEIAGGAPLDQQVRRVARYESNLLRSGHRYFFKVRSRTSWWATSGDSNIVSFVWYQPAAAPTDLQAVAGDGEISLNWQPVTALTDGSAPVGEIRYQVMRSVGGKDFSPIGEVQRATTFIDRAVQNGTRYFYTVQSMMVYRDELVNGGVSSAVAAVPVDLTPPLPPAGVTAVATDVGVKVFWERNSDADLGGYRVYRRAADQDDYQFLGTVSPEYTLYDDRKVSPGVRYYWAVSAFDQATPANESAVSREATIRN